MPIVPINPDLPNSYQLPGIYGYISTTGTGPSPLNRRIHFAGYKTSAGSWTAGTPARANNEQDVVNGAGTGSECHRWYRAMQAQGGVGLEVWFTPMNAPSGTAQTRIIKVLAMPSTDGHYGSSFGAVLDLDTKTGALAAGIWTLWICGYRCDCIVANGDTYAVIAANMLAEINKVVDYLPCTAGVSTATITLTMRHAALSSADLPVISTFTNQVAMYIAASCGTLTYLNAAGAGGSSILYCSILSAQTTITNGDTAAQIAANNVTAINNANAFSLAAAQAAATALLTLFYNNDCEVNWLATAITPAGTITTTLTPAFGAAAAGLPSSSTPSLATALTNIQGVTDRDGAFAVWDTSFKGFGSFITNANFTQSGSATDYSVMGTLSSFIEGQGNGRVCKGQRLIYADTRGLSTFGATATSTTPALTASPRYFPLYIPACPQQTYEMSARVCALIASQDYPPKNYAGMTLITDGKTPLLGTRAGVAMSDSDANACMVSYFGTPIRQNTQGQYTIVAGRTSAKPGANMDVRYIFWGQILTVDYFRDDLRQYLGAQLKGKSLKQYSQPFTTNCVTPEGIKNIIAARMLSWDGQDFYDGAQQLQGYLATAINVVNPARVDVSIPIRVPVPLEQVSSYLENVA